MLGAQGLAAFRPANSEPVPSRPIIFSAKFAISEFRSSKVAAQFRGSSFGLSRSHPALILTGSAPWLVRREPGHDKFLKNICRRTASDPDCRIFESQGRPAVLRGIIKIRNSTGGQSSQDAGIIRLPMPIVALADNRVGNGIA